MNQRSVIECLEANYVMAKAVTDLRSFSPLFFAFIREISYFLTGLALDMEKTIMNRNQEDPGLMESALQEYRLPGSFLACLFLHMLHSNPTISKRKGSLCPLKTFVYVTGSGCGIC